MGGDRRQRRARRLEAVPGQSQLTWTVSRLSGPAGELHALELPSPPSRHLWLLDATGPALVLGSAQADSTVDRAACDRARVDVVRRRSGGGAVLLVPGEALWIDVILPAG